MIYPGAKESIIYSGTLQQRRILQQRGWPKSTTKAKQKQKRKAQKGSRLRARARSTVKAVAEKGQAQEAEMIRRRRIFESASRE